MPDQFCPNCGTEVDADARFCPTCGQTLGDAPIDEGPVGAEASGTGAIHGDAAPEDDDTASPIPAAPSWPPSEPAEGSEPEPVPAQAAEEPSAGEPAAQAEPSAEPEPAAPEPEEEDDMDAEPPPVPAWRQQPPDATPPPGTPPPASPPTGSAPSGSQDELPITLPTMLSGWLIGGGSGFAALALLPSLANVLNVLIFVALLWVTATVFLADRMPRFDHQRLAILVTVILSLGIGLDRAAFTVRGVDTVFLVMALIAAAGALLVELDIDRPLPPSSGTG